MFKGVLGGVLIGGYVIIALIVPPVKQFECVTVGFH